MKRTMGELENAMTQNKIDNNAKYCTKAIEAGNASDAASFAIGAVRAARQLGITATEAELQAEPMLRLVTPTYVAEIESAYSDDARLQADMLGELTTEIVIQQTERGYKFQLPEYQAPSPEVVKALRGQCCISYQSGQAAGNPVRTFPANQLDYVKGFLAYWFSEQDPRGEKGKNRNGSKIISVRVSD